MSLLSPDLGSPSHGFAGMKTAAQPLLVSPREAARMLSLSERTLWSLTASGNLPRIKLGRLVRYSIDDLRQFIDQRR